MSCPAAIAGPSRPAAEVLSPGWAEKSCEVLVRKPVYRRQWFRRLALAAVLLAVAAVAIGGLFLLRWHRQQQADLARQRRSVEAFVRSPSFDAFARTVDAQFVAAINFTVLRPKIAGELLPDIAAAEKTGRQIPWALELSPLPVSTAERPARVHAAMRAAADLLAQRSLDFDGRSTEGRHAFLRLLGPHASAFLTDNPAQEFPALSLDRGMQRIVLEAYAARAGGTAEEIGRAFVVYSVIGPGMWRELEKIRASR